MLNKPDDRDLVANQNECDLSAQFIEEWLKIRIAQGLTREAALAELNSAAEALMSPRD